MASITIRNIEEDLKQRLRIRASEKGTSMEQATKDILRMNLYSDRQKAENLAEAIRSRFAPLGGVELRIPPRDSMPEPPVRD